jgi:hypothetical protein
MLPINKNQALEAARWIKSNFAEEINAALRGTPFTIDHVCAIACQESAFLWVGWTKSKTKDEILALLIGDAYGDYPGTVRTAFPKNTAAFRERYGDEFADMLIGEANKSRAARGFGPKQWVYKGYGIYQYDLQHVTTDESFFRERKWYSHAECLSRMLKVLKEKYAVHKDLWKAFKAYNGTGNRATEYANNVMIFVDYCREVEGGAAPAGTPEQPAVNFKSYLGKTFTISDPDARIRQPHEPLRYIYYTEGDLIPAGKKPGDPKTIPQGTKISVLDAKTIDRKLTFAYAAPAGGGMDEAFGWTTITNIQRRIDQRNHRTASPDRHQSVRTERAMGRRELHRTGDACRDHRQQERNRAGGCRKTQRLSEAGRRRGPRRRSNHAD